MGTQGQFDVILRPEMSLLDKINSPSDLRRLPPEKLPELAAELRDFIIEVVSTKEGHLGASLGVVELTIALHYIFDTPSDILVWDVGHQAYGHKILTGRREVFDTLRQLGGISGFPKRSESKYDAFGTGHSSTSISAVLGMALSARLSGMENRKHVAVIGDASIASGMAFEALNHAGDTQADILVVLNDNTIGIDPSVGALKKYLTEVKDGSATSGNLFECLNFDYLGPVDGHDLPVLLKSLEEARDRTGPRLLHVITTKGKGLRPAEENQVIYHAPGRFDPRTGALEKGDREKRPPKYQDVFGLTLTELAEDNPKIVGITPAMPTGSSLKIMMDRFPERAFDVGIAEQHAVTLAAGMAADGLIPFCTIYSTFLQRAYDQIIHDVALQDLPVIFCVDRAGLVGQDGATHHGVYDLAYLRCIPNLVIFAPMNEVALRNAMYTAQIGVGGPMAIRYPRGHGVLTDWRRPFEKLELGKGRELKRGTTIAVLSVGHIGNTVSDAISTLGSPPGLGHYDMGWVKPLDTALLAHILRTYSKVITVEDGSIAGGFGSAVLEVAREYDAADKVDRLGIADIFMGQGTIAELHKLAGIDEASIIARLGEELNS